jgi:hypothetical protein
MRLGRLLARSAITVQIVAATTFLSSSLSAAAEPSAVSATVANPTFVYGQTATPKSAVPSQTPVASSAEHPPLPRPFRTRDQVGFEQAKQRIDAEAAQTGALTEAQDRLTPDATSVRAVVKFAAMSENQQISLFGSGQSLEPPDTQAAAGPANVLELDNSTGSIWSKSGSLIKAFNLNTFFKVPSGYSFSDPRILYDAPTGRWFASGLSFNAQNNSQIYVAVSQSSDPAGSWLIYTIAANAQGIIFDQPKTGVSDDKLVISWDDYPNTTGPSSNAETWVLQKSDLLSGLAATTAEATADTQRFGLVPAQSLTSTTTEYLAYNNADPTPLTENQGSPTLGVVAITGTPGAANVVWTETDPAITATTIPPSAKQPRGTITTNDDRFLFSVWQNGLLWTGGNDACTPAGDTTTRSCLRLIEANTTGASPTVAQNFDLGLRGLSVY